jgi:hypothetical protein
MNAKIVLRITAAVLLPLAIGCTQGPGLVRGQNPSELTPPPGQPVRTVGLFSNGGEAEHSCPLCAAGQGQHGAHVAQPYQHVLNHGNHQGGAGLGHHPTHYNWFSYEQPRNLVYPPANQPAAVIQYPYYTVKGPSDFFMK